MTEAYDPKALVAKLKGKGLDIAEDAGGHIVVSVFEWLDESATLSKTPWDDMAKVIHAPLKEAALKLVDKIDGEVG